MIDLLFKNCGILATENDGFYHIRNGFLGVTGDSISYIGETRPADSCAAEKDMAGKLLMPGLINCHGHTGMTLLRGIGSDLPLDRWLYEEMFPVEDRMTAADIRAGTALAILEMIACGTTSFTDMYFFPVEAVALCTRIGIKANLCRPMQSFDANEPYEKSIRAKESIALFKEYHGSANGRIRIDFCIHAEYTCFPDIIAAYSADCRRLSGRMQLHLSETQKEHTLCKEKYGKTPAAFFNDLGTFDSPTLAAHCVAVEPEDMEILKEKGVSVIHNPTSNLKLGSGFAPIPGFCDMGVNVALGTDGAASNNNLNLFEEMHLAAIMHNGYLHDPTLLPPPVILKMATQNGALAQGRTDTGALQVGKKADIVAVSFAGPHMVPAFEPMAMLTYAAQAQDVVMTMVDGRILYENGEFLTMDKEEVLYDARQALLRLYGEREGV